MFDFHTCFMAVKRNFFTLGAFSVVFHKHMLQYEYVLLFDLGVFFSRHFDQKLREFENMHDSVFFFLQMQFANFSGS